MAKKKFNLDTDIADTINATDEAVEEVKKGYNPKSLKNLRTRESGTAKPKAYMQLNIYDYEDYIYRMSKVNDKSMTQYVLDLIDADMKANEEAYNGLKLLKNLDKPTRIAKNKPKNK